MERNKKISQYEFEYSRLIEEMKKNENPFDLLVKNEAIPPLKTKNKIKWYNRVINICDEILRSTSAYRDIFNGLVNFNNDFIKHMQTLYLVNKVHTLEDFVKFMNTALINKEMKNAIFGNSLVSDEIKIIVNYMHPKEEEIDELIIECLKKTDEKYQEKLDIYNIKLENKNKNNNNNNNQNKNNNNNNQYNPLNSKTTLNSEIWIVEKINFLDKQPHLHITKILNKFKQIGI